MFGLLEARRCGLQRCAFCVFLLLFLMAGFSLAVCISLLIRAAFSSFWCRGHLADIGIDSQECEVFLDPSARISVSVTLSPYCAFTDS
jgi:hypothetical protein